MRIPWPTPWLMLACSLIACCAWGGSLAHIEVYDRSAGRSLPVYEHHGRYYVAGEPGHRYELRIRNRGATRLLAVASVDGVNVVTGESAAPHQTGYVIDAWSSVAINGWRKNLDEIAAFYFTSVEDSYAARTGRERNVGVIGVAVFAERSRCCGPYLERQRSPSESAESTAPSEKSNARGAYAPREPRLGTGHGGRERSPAEYVDFRRDSRTPNETIVIYYDSRKNLLARGVIPKHPHLAHDAPDPFPARFVPDP